MSLKSADLCVTLQTHTHTVRLVWSATNLSSASTNSCGFFLNRHPHGGVGRGYTLLRLISYFPVYSKKTDTKLLVIHMKVNSWQHRLLFASNSPIRILNLWRELDEARPAGIGKYLRPFTINKITWLTRTRTLKHFPCFSWWFLFLKARRH